MDKFIEEKFGKYKEYIVKFKSEVHITLACSILVP